MSLPMEMNAVTIDRFGGPDVLTCGRRPVPEIGPGQVMVKVAYAGVGTWDPLIREGVFAEIAGEAPAFPFVLGTDGSGTIAAIGPGVERFVEGDPVYMVGGALYAEYVVLDAAAVSKVPNGLPLDQAGAMPVVALTAMQGLVDELKVTPGEAVLVNGASGDAGHVAVQLAKLLGTRVLAVVSGEDGVEAVRAFGADLVVDGKVADIGAVAREFAPDGLDAVLTFISGSGLDAAISAVREGGRVAFPFGVQPEPERRPGLEFHSFDLTHDAPATIGAKMARLNDLIASGPFEVRIAAVLPLDQAAEAHRMVSRHRIGKIVLTTDAS